MLRNFFYDNQIRRYLVQMMRLFNNFQYQSLDTNGNKILTQIPVVYGDPSRQAATVIANNSENTTPTVPIFAVEIAELKHDRSRIQDPTFVNTMTVRNRHYNPSTSQYTMAQGVDYNIERLMPVPYILTLKVELWTSNTEQKLQILEQVIPLFNMSFDVQSTDNYIDWTSLTSIFLEDSSWTSRTVPIGTDNPIDVASMTFTVPIWISAPAKVQTMGVIQTIIASIYGEEGQLSDDEILGGQLLSRQVITPLDFNVVLLGNKLTLFKQGDIDLQKNTLDADTKIGTPDNWHNFINMYGSLHNGVSNIKLSQPNGNADIVGTIAYNPLDDTTMIYNVISNTIPANTLPAIDAVINPQGVGPGIGNIPAAATGQSYLLINALGAPGSAYQETAWNGAIANANDIITYNGTNWIVTFNSKATTTTQYVTNITTSIQYRWTGTEWVKSVDGFYPAGSWQIIL
jgi:hypothetical protein